MAPFGEIEMELSVLIGEAAMPLDRLLSLGRGAVVPLGRGVDGPLTILANGLAIAEARVELDGERVNVCVTRVGDGV
jgi:flagellar motor switch protein FliN/FliY